MPFATRSQLYSILSDRTTVDRQLEELRRANTVRLLQLPTGRDEHAVMLTSDYCAALRRCKQAAVAATAAAATAQDGSSGSAAAAGATEPAAPAAAAAPAAVYDLFADQVLPACTEVMITHSELLQLLSGSSGKPTTVSG